MNWTTFNEALSLILHARNKSRAFDIVDQCSKRLGCSGLLVLHLLPRNTLNGFTRIELYSQNGRISNIIGRLKREVLSDGLKPIYQAAQPTHIADSRSFLRARLLSRLASLASITQTRSLLFIPVKMQGNSLYCFVFFGKRISDEYTSVAALSTLAQVTIETIVADKSPSKPNLENELTQREIECLRLMANGMDDPEIAIAVGISERTVRFHLDRARSKIGARNRVHAVAMIFGHQLLGR